MKKDKNGFTLVELIAVVAILAVVITIVIVKVDNNIKNANNFSDEQSINLIESAAYLYAENNLNEISNLNSLDVATVTIETLINKGYLERKKVEKYGLSDIVVIANINDVIKAKYTKTSKPVIFINGSKNISLNVGKTYNELGAYVAIPNTGVQELESSNISSTVNKDEVGKYTVTYSYTNADNVIREVLIVSK